MSHWMLWAVKFSLHKKVSKCLPKWICPFAFSAAVSDSSCCSMSLSALDIVSMLDFGHSNRWVVFHCCLKVHFPNENYSEHFFVPSSVRCLFRFWPIFKLGYQFSFLPYVSFLFMGQMCNLKIYPLRLCLVFSLTQQCLWQSKSFHFGRS